MAQTIRRGPVSGTVKAKAPRPFLLDFWSSSLGKKWVMAVSGLVGLGFVFFHMIGNLKMYLGEEDLNHYAEFLRDLLYPIAPEKSVLWLLRLGLIGALLVHLLAAAQLTVQNRRARPVRYQSQRDYVAANFASRSMRWTGILVFLFIVWHLMDLTWGWVNPDYESGEVYANVVASLERWPVAFFYILANLALGVHLFHGTWSIFQTMGWNNPRFNAWRRWFAVAFAAVIVIGNVSFPVAVLAGIVE